ncbi:MAG: GvpL/GvpF family gas vesicle protein [Planctomycetota bacterium]
MTPTDTSPIESVVYLVGFAPRGALTGFTSTGLEPEQAARVEPLGTFDAIIIYVPATMFIGDDADARLQDVTWLSPRAARHESILQEAAARAPIMPIGFGSVFTSSDRIAETLAEHADDITEFFATSADCDEWSIKAWVDRDAAIAQARASIARERTNTGGGAAYLRARRMDDEAERFAEDHALALVDDLLDQIDPCIVDAVERRVVEADEDSGRWTIAHVALLIHRDVRAAFDSTLDEAAALLDAEGIHLELSGPWAPYSFCPQLGSTDDDTDTDDA